ncbi:MAG: aconitate hydratase AcnA [Coriobacteriaceae bacterium]|uniref:aconitate hydratase AcnA n=1 Tax=Tractidigestivibacter sp. TaxID=2847320 RepID=UPI002A7FB64D|nr:aconitate hydratase AcnA [Tractidigestivibacter sp.]MCI7437686.1 aconitate hydratase AcnA [Coriobacteriaceae bacterium]MDD7584056.1 aconitate hydratase AcnA [Coriobacteriaceae bacterium]MDY4533643.1 aconitate hydratase AcnA [Tractidigestivibacter sp.]
MSPTEATPSTREFREAVLAARRPVRVCAGGREALAFDVSGIPGADRLPRALVGLLENVVRRSATDDDAVRQAQAVIEAGLAGEQGAEIEFMPARVLFQDFTGVPVFVDFASMRDAMVERGGDPARVNPHIPCTLVVDHSVIADVSGTEDACERNQELEAKRNRERFAFLKWAGESFGNVEIVPPGGGICHQLNIERFCRVVTTDALSSPDGPVACFDTLVGTDSHTTTANGVGVMGWGVGGIEAEAAALGQPISMLVPPVVELRLTGALRDGVSGMDLALTVAQLMRAAGVVGCLVEVTGEGVAGLTATQRSCVANMTPEYGATTTLFPVDEETLGYLRLTGRTAADVAFARAYLERQGVFGDTSRRTYARSVTLDLATVEPSLAGPSRPHDRVTVAGLRERFERSAEKNGHGDLSQVFEVACGGTTHRLRHGALAIAAITSCTTATDPAMMVAAGLLAKRAVERGLAPKPWVKKILAPGSHATQLLLERAGLTAPLAELGFFTCGFGCMSCIGNSGDIHPALRERADEMELTSVLSGNRNFEGRISPHVSQNYLCQPAYVVAYSLVGTMDADLSCEPVGTGAGGEPVMLADLVPTDAEVAEVLSRVLTPSLFADAQGSLKEGPASWRAIGSSSSSTFPWDGSSTYVRRAPYFEIARRREVVEVRGARALALLGDFVTTDHISPAGAIAPDSPAARYLTGRGVARQDFNTYGSRRGNHEVMARGTFANVKLRNALAGGRVGGWTRDLLDGEVKSIYDAAVDYAEHGVPLVVVAGKLYGSGSSRDWAGKGPLLLGVQAVIAESFERIHRSNLVQMGVLPLQFREGESASTLGLTGEEAFDVSPVSLADGLPSPREVEVTATRPDGSKVSFACVVRVDTPMEGRFLAKGGILPYVLDEIS